jgi:hypothetical protein
VPLAVVAKEGAGDLTAYLLNRTPLMVEQAEL